MRRSSAVFVGLIALTAAFAGAPARADRVCAHVHLPEKIDSLGETLLLNGLGVRRATFLNVKVYVAGLYLARPTTSIPEILQPTRSKQLTLHFVRHVSRGDMLSAIRDGLHDNASAEEAAAEQHVQSMERYLPDLHTGTVLRLAYRPKRGLQVFANDKLVGIEKDDTFANLLFRIWLGPKPPDSGLKAGLLGGECD
jgi:hypothetical protein